jgi:LysR family glycine cleavage system transcriptional activator
MMSQRLPSLNALRAFEAAARHLSLTKAARELNVTPAAVSHQVKALEADLGVSLLRRVKGEFVLTETAQTVRPVLSAGFDRIAEAVRRLRADEALRFLTVSVSPTFAANWLVRRLGAFKTAFPEIDVRLQTTNEITEFARDGVDIAIRFGAGDYPGLHAIRLFDEEIFPVCSPALLERGPPLVKPADLAGHTLLHVEWSWSMTRGEPLDWQMWLHAAGADDVDATRGPRFSYTSFALQAAADGQGLALGSEALAGDDLAAGRLVRPFDVVLPVNFAYYLVYPEDTADRPKIANFRQWILAEIDAGQPH